MGAFVPFQEDFGLSWCPTSEEDDTPEDSS
jgi:hypothetical protein